MWLTVRLGVLEGLVRAIFVSIAMRRVRLFVVTGVVMVPWIPLVMLIVLRRLRM